MLYIIVNLKVSNIQRGNLLSGDIQQGASKYDVLKLTPI